HCRKLFRKPESTHSCSILFNSMRNWVRCSWACRIYTCQPRCTLTSLVIHPLVSMVGLIRLALQLWPETERVGSMNHVVNLSPGREQSPSYLRADFAVRFSCGKVATI